MNGLLKEIESRRAFRGISDSPIEAEVQDRILTAATYAPSCSNKQPWRFIVANNDDARQKVQDGLLGGNYWAKKAPLFVLAATKPDLDCNLKENREYALFDVGQAVMSLQYQAVHEGLVVHPMAGFKDEELKKLFNIPDDYVLITVIAIAHPGDDTELSDKHKELEHSARTRFAREQVIALNQWKFEK
ncbi:MAG: nitroreductase family protein [Spirochaetaceae bacterium]|nr:nitroreductase family protein [Spirochaetaceae bacterium]MCF7948316.1 nitroreductase family protein [Spirochaetia bacterium]MCF7951532.1 nitroreductase family protein [Spirochaetaceae bacterium]